MLISQLKRLFECLLGFGGKFAGVHYSPLVVWLNVMRRFIVGCILGSVRDNTPRLISAWADSVSTGAGKLIIRNIGPNGISFICGTAGGDWSGFLTAMM